MHSSSIGSREASGGIGIRHHPALTIIRARLTLPLLLEYSAAKDAGNVALQIHLQITPIFTSSAVVGCMVKGGLTAAILLIPSATADELGVVPVDLVGGLVARVVWHRCPRMGTEEEVGREEGGE